LDRLVYNTQASFDWINRVRVLKQVASVVNYLHQRSTIQNFTWD